MFYIIYKTTNTLNGKYYIGYHATNDLGDGYLGSGIALTRAVRKYGRQNFRREILYVFETEHEARKREREVITEDVISDPNSYNLAEGGYGGIGTAARQGKQHTPAARAKRSIALKKAWERDPARRVTRSHYMREHNPTNTEEGRQRSRRAGARMARINQERGSHPTIGRVTCRNIHTGVIASIPREQFLENCEWAGADQELTYLVGDQHIANRHCFARAVSELLGCDVGDAVKFYDNNIASIRKDGKITRKHKTLSQFAGKRWSELGIRAVSTTS